MHLQEPTDAQIAYPNTRPRFVRTMSIVITAGLVMVAGLSLPGTVTASNDEGSGECSNRTLRGDYGIQVSGTRPLGPGVVESFVATAMRTYDGRGHFTQIDNFFGVVAGYQRDVPAYGTYEVHANCSGTSQIFFPGAPGPVDTAFVIVAHGDEVKDATFGTTASLWRVGR
jgi:hypothetical protein